MADVTILQLPTLPPAAITGADVLPIVDVSDLTDPGGTTKQVTVSGLRSTANTNNGVYSVTDNGADPTGVTDSTTAFNTVLGLAGTQGGVAYVPPGTYKITFLTWPNAQVILQGSGVKSTILQCSANQGGGNLASVYLGHYINTNTSRFSQINDLQIQAVGGNTALRINNLGTHLHNVWCNGGTIGIEANSLVTATWDTVVASGSSNGVMLRNAGTDISTNDVVWLNRCASLSASGVTTGIGITIGANAGQNTFLNLDTEQCTTGIRCITGGLQRNTFLNAWSEVCSVAWVTEDSGCSNFWIDQYVRTADGVSQTFGTTTGYQLGNIITTPTIQGPTITNGVTVGGSTTFTDAAARFVPGTTSLSVRNHANNTDNVLITDAGNMSIHGNFGINGVSAIAKPTVTGSKGANAALASLLTALASYGLITDSST